jgi:hypothetical protein
VEPNSLGSLDRKYRDCQDLAVANLRRPVLAKKPPKKIDVKLSDGTRVIFDDTMSDTEIEQKLDAIEKQIHSLRPKTSESS